MLVALVEEELVVDPEADDDLAGALVEDAVALDHVVVEDALVHLPVRQLYVALPVLRVALELTLVVGPLVAQLRKVLVVELLLEGDGLRVVDSALAVEFVVLPVPFVGYLPVLIVQLAEAVHLVVLPLAFVVASVFEVEAAVPVPLVVAFVALVPSSLGYLFFYELQLQLLLVVVEEGQVRKARSAGEVFAFGWAREVGDERGADDRTAVASIHGDCA